MTRVVLLSLAVALPWVQAMERRREDWDPITPSPTNVPVEGCLDDPDWRDEETGSVSCSNFRNREYMCREEWWGLAREQHWGDWADRARHACPLACLACDDWLKCKAEEAACRLDPQCQAQLSFVEDRLNYDKVENTQCYGNEACRALWSCRHGEKHAKGPFWWYQRPHYGGKSSDCKNLGCVDSLGLDDCKDKCEADGECNTINLCPEGGSCTAGADVNRCCKKRCEYGDLKLTDRFGGWAVYSIKNDVAAYEFHHQGWCAWGYLIDTRPSGFPWGISFHRCSLECAISPECGYFAYDEEENSCTRYAAKYDCGPQFYELYSNVRSTKKTYKVYREPKVYVSKAEFNEKVPVCQAETDACYESDCWKRLVGKVVEDIFEVGKHMPRSMKTPLSDEDQKEYEALLKCASEYLDSEDACYPEAVACIIDGDCPSELRVTESFERTKFRPAITSDILSDIDSTPCLTENEACKTMWNCRKSLPTEAPTAIPSTIPTGVPSATPTAVPTPTPSAVPTTTPTATPTMAPVPSMVPTPTPSAVPTATPTATPTMAPIPTIMPTPTPSAVPTPVPTGIPTEESVFYFKEGNCNGALEISKISGQHCVSTRGLKYPNNVKCTIGVVAPVSISFHTFHVEYQSSCSWDYLRWNGYRWCGNGHLHLGTKVVETDMLFYTDYMVQDRGFKFCTVGQ